MPTATDPGEIVSLGLARRVAPDGTPIHPGATLGPGQRLMTAIVRVGEIDGERAVTISLKMDGEVLAGHDIPVCSGDLAFAGFRLIGAFRPGIYQVEALLGVDRETATFEVPVDEAGGTVDSPLAGTVDPGPSGVVQVVPGDRVGCNSAS